MPDYRARIDAVLGRCLPPAGSGPEPLTEGMRYAALGPGKRMRPLMAYATGEVLGIAADRIDPIAAAVELIHAYSLVHDDLPSMDDDDLRRGRPTTHVVYDEATAILVGDALQVLAFQILATEAIYECRAEVRRKLISILAEATGSFGMVGGQAMDIAAEGNWLTAENLEKMYSLKTGCLIRAAIMMPCHCRSDISSLDFDALDRFSATIGLAFQVKDDLLEVEEDTQTIGKHHGSDEKNAKATYPALFGKLETHARAETLYCDALAELDPLGERAAPLRWLSEFVVRRNR
ncbi:MAG: polyprenyl synthetase family protein [Gammaproteobacteria bacterium]|nr:polyprenyl synthetase family protein [Gammaproteobacteria bacterium]